MNDTNLHAYVNFSMWKVYWNVSASPEGAQAKAKYKMHYKFKEKQQQNHSVHKQCWIVLNDVYIKQLIYTYV